MEGSSPNTRREKESPEATRSSSNGGRLCIDLRTKSASQMPDPGRKEEAHGRRKML